MKRSLGVKPISFPLPAYLVGSYDHEGRPNIMMAAWGGICNSEPPCLAVSVRQGRWTYAAIMERRAFTVSIPPARLTAEADFTGLVSGRDTDKFGRAGLTPVRSELVDAPYVDECPVVIELTLFKTVELGSHVQFIGKIVDVKATSDCIGEGGILDIDLVDPILFDTAKKNYHAIGAVTGKAWSVGKAFVKN
jgi:flavin reductase (DIM6/NTAB) family NADH-FMN oxidoreductase RutF